MPLGRRRTKLSGWIHTPFLWSCDSFAYSFSLIYKNAVRGSPRTAFGKGFVWFLLICPRHPWERETFRRWICTTPLASRPPRLLYDRAANYGIIIVWKYLKLHIQFSRFVGSSFRSLSGTVRFRDMIVSYFRRKVYGLAVQVAHPLSSSSGIQQTKKRSWVHSSDSTPK